MRPVRFVALSADGQSLVLRDEGGRMLTLPLDDRVAAAARHEYANQGQLAMDTDSALTPRDIQARIRAGESADDVARLANAPMEKVLRFAGPVLQERAAVALAARRTRLRTSDDGASLGDVVDVRLKGHGVDPATVAWDSYRKDDGNWRVTATWPSGRATAHAAWDLDKPRTVVSPVDEMAQFLSAEKQPAILAHDDPPRGPRGGPGGGPVPDDLVDTREIPVVPSLAVLRPRRPDLSPTRALADDRSGAGDDRGRPGERLTGGQTATEAAAAADPRRRARSGVEPGQPGREGSRRVPGELPRSERPGERLPGERTAAGRPPGERAAGDRAAGDRAAGDRAAGDRGQGERDTGERGRVRRGGESASAGSQPPVPSVDLTDEQDVQAVGQERRADLPSWDDILFGTRGRR